MNQVAIKYQTLEMNGFVDDKARIYPNPAEDYVKIEIPMSSSACRIDMLNCTGRLVKSVEFTGSLYSLNISEIVSGIYILRLSYNQKIETFKLIVE